MSKMKKMTVYLPAETRHRLAKMARRRNESQARLIREALENFLAEYDRPSWRSVGAGQSVTLTGRTVRNWLQDNWHTTGHTG